MHRAPPWIRVLALEVVNDPSAAVREETVARWVLNELEEHGDD